MTNTAYGVRGVSHYQSSTPGPVIAAFGSYEEASALAEELSTCSFCSPGRARQYSTGRCYEVVRTSRQPGYVLADIEDRVLESITGLAR